MRYADDILLGFQHRAEADRFLELFRERLRKFGLELHPDKTRRIEFGRYAERDREQRGEGKPETFDFLSFTHISGKNRKGTYTVRRMTIRKRMRAKLQQIKLQLRKRMHDPVAQTGAWLRSVVQRYFNYYAVPGNFDSLNAFRTQVSRFWHWTLLRRSQKRQFNWVKMRKQIEYWIPNRACSIPTPRHASPPPIRDGAVCANERPYGSVRGASGN